MKGEMGEGESRGGRQRQAKRTSALQWDWTMEQVLGTPGRRRFVLTD